MQKRKFTVVTQLHETNNTNLIEYFDTTRVLYAKAMRETFHVLKRVDNLNKSSYNTYLQNKYDITRRTANSILSDAQGRLNALTELKKYEKTQLIRKINHLENSIIPKLVEKRNDHNEKLRQKLSVSLVKHRNLRRKIVAKKSKLNHLKQKVVILARTTGKDVCIEDLNFKNKKAQTESKSGKKYNNMLHSLAYSQFMTTIESCAYQNQVVVNKVNPVWTSWLAKQLYCPTMKLNVHTGASYVIARRGQGYNDSV